MFTAKLAVRPFACMGGVNYFSTASKSSLVCRAFSYRATIWPTLIRSIAFTPKSREKFEHSVVERMPRRYVPRDELAAFATAHIEPVDFLPRFIPFADLACHRLHFERGLHASISAAHRAWHFGHTFANSESRVNRLNPNTSVR